MTSENQKPKGKYISCEQCDRPLSKGECLSAIEFWKTDSRGHRLPFYLWVCDHCGENRNQWCTEPFPENCEKCGAEIEVGDLKVERKYNRDGKGVAWDGLYPGETCRLICAACDGAAALD